VRTRPLLCFCMSLLVVANAFGHAKETHLKLSQGAVNYLATIDSSRPFLAHMNQQLPFGAWNEDVETRLRFFFHFSPALNNSVAGIKVSATCSSSDWGFGSQFMYCGDRGSYYDSAKHSYVARRPR
jgi:hypothetical protein